MARTKQTCRKSTGGKAPRKQLASRSTRAVRSFLLGQQATGVSSSKPSDRKIFINCENTFGSFAFRRPATREVFHPSVSVARISPPSLSQEIPPPTELLMRLDFLSCLDGNSDNIQRSRPPLDAVFVVDISGSMSMAFKDDKDRRSKFEVATNCMESIFQKFTDQDRIAVVTFNTETTELCPINFATSANKSKTIHAVKGVRVGGGTDLAKGLEGGFAALSTGSPDSSGIERMQRVFFLTDMESSPADEAAVIAMSRVEAMKGTHMSAAGDAIIELSSDNVLGKRKATKKFAPAPPPKEGKMEGLSRQKLDSRSSPAYVTVVGIGVDLSVSTVEKISSIPGAKYMSVINSEELYSTVAEDFNFDVTPIAFDITVTMPGGITINKVSGSAELNSLVAGSSKAKISAEFPVPLDESGSCNGGLYLFHLNEESSMLIGEKKCISVSWYDRNFNFQSCEVPIIIPPVLNASEPRTPLADPGLCKARALEEYVSVLTNYAVNGDANPTIIGVAAAPPRETLLLLQELAKDGFSTFTSLSQLPVETPRCIESHFRNLLDFSKLRLFLISELARVDDVSLGSNNQNILDTVVQIENLEKEEITSILQSYIPTPSIGSIPRGMVCPIGLVLMVDPVIAADGHSYDRHNITEWLKSNTSSPITNLELSSNVLIPNHSLKAAIQDYNAKQESLSEIAEEASDEDEDIDC